jgi:hypothetical protein
MSYDGTQPRRVVSMRTYNRLKAWAERRPIVALMGEFSAGKSTLMNFLIEEDLLPTRATATELPPVWLSHGERSAHWVDAGGGVHPLDLAEIRKVPIDARFIRIHAAAEILEHCDIIDTPGISDPNLAVDSWRHVAGQSNMVLWCSSATQAWRETERSAWLSLPERLRRNSLLVVTRADKLLTESDRQKVSRRLARETGGLFAGHVFVATHDAVQAKAELAQGIDSRLWIESGAEALLDALAERFEAIYEERLALLRRYEIEGQAPGAVQARRATEIRAEQSERIAQQSQRTPYVLRPDERADDNVVPVRPVRPPSGTQRPARPEAPMRDEFAGRPGGEFGVVEFPSAASVQPLAGAGDSAPAPEAAHAGWGVRPDAEAPFAEAPAEAQGFDPGGFDDEGELAPVPAGELAVGASDDTEDPPPAGKAVWEEVFGADPFMVGSPSDDMAPAPAEAQREAPSAPAFIDTAFAQPEDRADHGRDDDHAAEQQTVAAVGDFAASDDAPLPPGGIVAGVPFGSEGTVEPPFLLEAGEDLAADGPFPRGEIAALEADEAGGTIEPLLLLETGEDPALFGPALESGGLGPDGAVPEAEPAAAGSGIWPDAADASSASIPEEIETGFTPAGAVAAAEAEEAGSAPEVALSAAEVGDAASADALPAGGTDPGEPVPPEVALWREVVARHPEAAAHAPVLAVIEAFLTELHARKAGALAPSRPPAAGEPDVPDWRRLA